MQTETAGLDFVETAATQFRRVDGWTLITEQNFQAIGWIGSARVDAAAIYLDGLIGPSVIAVAHDIGQGFINRASDRAAVWRREPENLSKAFESATYDAEQLGVTMQLKFQ